MAPLDPLAVQLAFYHFLREIGIAIGIVFAVFLAVAALRVWMDHGRD